MSFPHRHSEWPELHEAVWFGDTRRVVTLALGGHDLDVRDSRGCTPVQVAASKHHLNMLAILKICGASLDRMEHAASDGLPGFGDHYPLRRIVVAVVFDELRRLREASKWQVAVYTNVLPAEALAELLRARRLPTPDHSTVLGKYIPPNRFEMWGEGDTLRYANSVRSWSPSAHLSFPATYRQVVLLCLGAGVRKGGLSLPVDVWQLILGFVSREDL